MAKLTIEQLYMNEILQKNDWDKISKRKLPKEIIDEFKTKINWTIFSEVQNESALEESLDNLDWYYVAKNEQISVDFIKKYKDKFDFCVHEPNFYRKLNLNDFKYLIESNIKINWEHCPFLEMLTEDFIREYKDRIDFKRLFENQKLSLEFIIEFKDKLEIEHLSEYRKNIDKEFIDALKDDVYSTKWGFRFFLENRYISEELIEYLNEYKPFTKDDWHSVSAYQTNLSNEFVEKYKDNLDWKSLCEYRKNWTIEELRKYEKYAKIDKLKNNTNLYDIIFTNK